MPSPMDTELRVQDSPVPTQITLGSVGSKARAPIDCTGFLSKIGLNVVPPSSDFQTPPEAAPTRTMVLPSWLRAATAETRPLIAAEPMLRAPRPEITPWSITGRPLVAGGRGGVAAMGTGGPGTMARVTAAAEAGNRKTLSSASTLTSARSTTIRLVRGDPLAPDSIENGIQTPATSS